MFVKMGGRLPLKNDGGFCVIPLNAFNYITIFTFADTSQQLSVNTSGLSDGSNPDNLSPNDNQVWVDSFCLISLALILFDLFKIKDFYHMRVFESDVFQKKFQYRLDWFFSWSRIFLFMFKDSFWSEFFPYLPCSSMFWISVISISSTGPSYDR